MKKILTGITIGLCLPFVAGYLFVSLGGIPVATKGSPLPLEKTIARKALHAAMNSEVNRPSPLLAEEANFLAGARVYQAQCAFCHGGLDLPVSGAARGMFPKPPQLLPPNMGVTDDTIGEIYWIIKNGIRLTGMPGYSDSLSDTEIWQVSLTLLHADNLSPSVYEILGGNNIHR